MIVSGFWLDDNKQTRLKGFSPLRGQVFFGQYIRLEITMILFYFRPKKQIFRSFRIFRNRNFRSFRSFSNFWNFWKFRNFRNFRNFTSFRNAMQILSYDNASSASPLASRQLLERGLSKLKAGCAKTMVEIYSCVILITNGY